MVKMFQQDAFQNNAFQTGETPPAGKQYITATGIVSAESFGVPTIHIIIPPQIISPTGIPSAESFGTPQLNQILKIVGIPSEETFGIPSIVDWGNYPKARFSNDIFVGKIPMTVNFRDFSSGHPTSWYWSFGDGQHSTESNPIHQYTTVGTYTVSLVVSNINGSNELIKKNLIIVNPAILNVDVELVNNDNLILTEIDIGDVGQGMQSSTQILNIKNFGDPVKDVHIKTGEGLNQMGTGFETYLAMFLSLDNYNWKPEVAFNLDADETKQVYLKWEVPNNSDANINIECDLFIDILNKSNVEDYC